MITRKTTNTAFTLDNEFDQAVVPGENKNSKSVLEIKKNISSTRSLLHRFWSPPENKSKVKSQLDENSPLLPKSQSLPDFQAESIRHGYGILPERLPEIEMKGGCAKVYIWDKSKGSQDSTKRPVGHVSMQLFTADEKKISWEEGGYISVYPVEECDLEIKSIAPSHSRPDSYWLIKEPQQNWRLLYIDHFEIEREIDINSVPSLIAALPDHKMPEELSKTEKFALYRVIRAYKNKILPWQQIVCRQNVEEDNSIEGDVFNRSFKIWNIDIVAIKNYFKENIQNGKMKWKLESSGCFKSNNSTNCVEAVLDLLINHGQLNVSLHTISPRKNDEADKYKMDEIIEAIQTKHGCCLPIVKGCCLVFPFLLGLVGIGGVAFIMKIELQGVYIPPNVSLNLFAISLALIAFSLIVCCNILNVHPAISPADLNDLLDYLSKPENLSNPDKRSVTLIKNIFISSDEEKINQENISHIGIIVNSHSQQDESNNVEEKIDIPVATLLPAKQALTDEEKESLVEAAITGDSITIEQYLQSGGAPDVKDKYGRTLLFLAVYNQHTLVEKALLKYKANPNIEWEIELQGKRGAITPLHQAARLGRDSTVKLLLKEKAAVNKKFMDGTTPLIRAAIDNHYTTTSLLLKHNASVNDKTNPSGYTSLFFAAKNGNSSMVKLLLESKADINRVANKGDSALDIAQENGNQNVVNILKQWTRQK